MKRALLLLAHGSRDAQWRRPVERLARALRKKSRRAAVALAYLERTRPDLETAVARLARSGCHRLTIVPVFLGSGRHLKRDLAARAAGLRRRHEGMRIVVTRALGEHPGVIAAMAAAISQGEF